MIADVRCKKTAVLCYNQTKAVLKCLQISTKTHGYRFLRLCIYALWATHILIKLNATIQKRISSLTFFFPSLKKESADLGNEILKSLDALEFHEEVK